jgi:GT2 family glycosyltransferase
MVTALIPSYAPDPESLAALTDSLRDAGIRPVVIANGRGALDACVERSIPHVCWSDNLGFGRSINRAVRELGIDDNVLVLNDDISVDAIDLATSLGEAKLFGTDRPWVLSLGEEQQRRIPNSCEIFANLSLIDRLTTRFRPRFPSRSTGPTYRAFSAVLISREAWRATGGFDERYPFTFEDSDFVRSLGLADRGAAFHIEGATSVRHHRSRTSSAQVERVLPVVVWSALLYLDKWERRRTRGKLLIALALVLRVLLVPWSRAPVGAHLRGIRASVQTLLRDAEPPLPPFG